jgi:hypothetical protein
MKLHAGLVIAAALAVGGAVYFWQGHAQPRAESHGTSRRELAWLQHEFHLSSTAMERIASIHTQYTFQCQHMCDEVNASDAEVRRLVLANRTLTADLEKALDRSSSTVAMCRRRMLEHFYAIAREMPDDKAQRYLTMMSPMIEHPAAPPRMHAH